MPTSDDADLDRAYGLRSSADAQALYDEWATTYDQGFADSRGYVAPRETARHFLAAAGPADQPVLDIGAGTGLLAAHLADLTVDGIDISEAMLDVAAAKGLYRDRIVADLTQPIARPDASYGGLISSGTFTHGHVGPVCLPELLRIARPDALFCLGIRPDVYDQAGFGSAFALLVAAGAITPLQFHDIQVYEAPDHPHAKDRGLVAVFRKR